VFDEFPEHKRRKWPKGCLFPGDIQEELRESFEGRGTLVRGRIERHEDTSIIPRGAGKRDRGTEMNRGRCLVSQSGMAIATACSQAPLYSAIAWSWGNLLLRDLSTDSQE
jgi:hypothetical protein